MLHDYLEAYNIKSSHQGRDTNCRTPIRAFIEGITKAMMKEVPETAKSTKLKAA